MCDILQAVTGGVRGERRRRMTRRILGFIPWMLLLITATTTASAAEPKVVRLWPGDPPATQPYDPTDRLTERKDGGFNLTNVRHPSLAVYLPSSTTKPSTT